MTQVNGHLWRRGCDSGRVVPSGVGSIIINVLFLFSFSSVEQIIQYTVAIATTIIMCV